MKYLIEKSSVPVLWLDTFAITQIAYAIFQKEQGQKYNKKLFEQFTQLVHLRVAKKIIIFESDQLLEIAVREELVKLSKRVLSQLSGGLIVHSWEVREKQLMLALNAFAKTSTTETINWSDIYSDDPLKDRGILGFLIRCDFGINLRLNQKRKMDAAIYSNWKNIRNKYSNSSNKSNFLKQYKLEKSSGSRLAQDTISKVNEGIFTKHHPLYFNLIDGPGSYLDALIPNVTSPESIMIDFYKSSYFIDLPMKDISSILFAERLCGSEDIKKSDQTDIENISAFLPYVNYMIIDKAMADKVIKHKLDKKYNAKIIRLNDLDEVIKSCAQH
jgi:hypothetical protein